MEEKKIPHHGKQPNHKMKTYIVLQYLLKYTDENNVASAKDIVAFLEECGLTAERRSIYRDIKEINTVALMMEEECDIDTATEMLEGEGGDELKLVVYDEHKKGFYIRQRHFDLNDMRLLAECVYATKFIPEKQAKRLVQVVCDFVSDSQARQIKHDVYLTDRIKTQNNQVILNISTINEAMSREWDGETHTPEKISFKYLKYQYDDMNNQVERRKGSKYVVSPYKLIINDGNYYLLAYDDKKKDIVPYRIDRMKAVSLTGEERTGLDVYRKLDLKNYSQRVFSMYRGRRAIVRIQFVPTLLDTMIERFGTKFVSYDKVDDRHYTVEAEVEISDQFYGWLLGFGKRAKMVRPAEEVELFTAYIDKVRSAYG